MIRKSLPVAAARLATLLSIPIMATGAETARAQAQDHVVVGVGVAAMPNYQGSGDYRILPLPAIDIKQGWFFANLRNGVGIEPINTANITIGASAVFVQGIRGKDLPTDIDKLPDAVGARLFTNIRAGGFVATLGATKVLGGTKGTIADASLSYPVQVTSRFMLTPTIGTTWADRKYNDRYFGVTADEALASGLPQFTASSGFKDISGSLTASYRLTDRISLSATGSVSSLLGEVKDSPIVEKKTQPFGILAFTYRL
jgi:outer membrane protein